MSRAQYAEEVHARYTKPPILRHVFVPFVDHTWASDQAGPLGDPKANRGYQYMTFVLDAFSRYLWVVPQKSITATATWGTFEGIMETSERKPKKLWVDDGVAYWGKTFAAPAKRAGIELYSTQGDGKSVLAERVIQTITSWLWEEMTAKGTEDWVSLLPGTVARYNNTKHRSLGMTPAEASDPENAEAAFDTQYGPPQAVERPLLKVGDWVRLARLKGTFEKGRNERWTTELYRVVEVNNRAPPAMYKVADALGDVLKGRFYGAQLRKSKFSSESQRELLFPPRDPASAGPDEVAEVLGYRMHPTNTSKYGRYLISVRLGDGSTEEVPLQAYVGRVNKQGVFKATPRNPDQVLSPIGDWLEATLPDVWATI